MLLSAVKKSDKIGLSTLLSLRQCKPGSPSVGVKRHDCLESPKPPLISSFPSGMIYMYFLCVSVLFTQKQKNCFKKCGPFQNGQSEKKL